MKTLPTLSAFAVAALIATSVSAQEKTATAAPVALPATAIPAKKAEPQQNSAAPAQDKKAAEPAADKKAAPAASEPAAPVDNKIAVSDPGVPADKATKSNTKSAATPAPPQRKAADNSAVSPK